MIPDTIECFSTMNDSISDRSNSFMIISNDTCNSVNDDLYTYDYNDLVVGTFLMGVRERIEECKANHSRVIGIFGDVWWSVGEVEEESLEEVEVWDDLDVILYGDREGLDGVGCIVEVFGENFKLGNSTK